MVMYFKVSKCCSMHVYLIEDIETLFYEELSMITHERDNYDLFLGIHKLLEVDIYLFMTMFF